MLSCKVARRSVSDTLIFGQRTEKDIPNRRTMYKSGQHGHGGLALKKPGVLGGKARGQQGGTLGSFFMTRHPSPLLLTCRWIIECLMIVS